MHSITPTEWSLSLCIIIALLNSLVTVTYIAVTQCVSWEFLASSSEVENCLCLTQVCTRRQPLPADCTVRDGVSREISEDEQEQPSESVQL